MTRKQDSIFVFEGENWNLDFRAALTGLCAKGTAMLPEEIAGIAATIADAAADLRNARDARKKT